MNIGGGDKVKNVRGIKGGGKLFLGSKVTEEPPTQTHTQTQRQKS